MSSLTGLAESGADSALRAAQRRVLGEFRRVLVQEAHHLRLMPDLLWQQTYNRLQWADGEEAGPVSGLLAPELEARSRPGAGPWLHLLTRPRESKALIRTLGGHESVLHALAYSPDGTRLLSGGTQFEGGRGYGTLTIWDAATGEDLATLTTNSQVEAAGDSADGTRIVSGSANGALTIWDADGGTELFTASGHTSDVLGVAYSPDGTRIVSGSRDGTLTVWDAAGGVRLATLSGHEAGVNAVAYSPDGTRIASGSADKTIRIWDAADGEQAIFSGHALEVTAVAYSPDGAYLASASADGGIRIWDVASGIQCDNLRWGENLRVWAIAYSPDGDYIAAGSQDGTVRIWNAAGSNCVATLTGQMSAVWSVAYSPDGTRIVCGSDDGDIKVWDVAAALAPAGADTAGLDPRMEFVFAGVLSDLLQGDGSPPRPATPWVAPMRAGWRPSPSLQTAAAWSLPHRT